MSTKPKCTGNKKSGGPCGAHQWRSPENTFRLCYTHEMERRRLEMEERERQNLARGRVDLTNLPQELRGNHLPHDDMTFISSEMDEPEMVGHYADMDGIEEQGENFARELAEIEEQRVKLAEEMADLANQKEMVRLQWDELDVEKIALHNREAMDKINQKMGNGKINQEKHESRKRAAQRKYERDDRLFDQIIPMLNSFEGHNHVLQMMEEGVDFKQIIKELKYAKKHNLSWNRPE